MGLNIRLPELSKAELTPAVVELLEIAQGLAQRVHLQEEEIGRLKDEIAVLKKQKKRPKIKPSKMDDDTGGGDPGNTGSPRSRAPKRENKKTQDLEIHHSEVVKVEGVHKDWTFKGYERMFPTRIPGIVIINNGLSHFLRKYVVTNMYENMLADIALIWYICTH